MEMISHFLVVVCQKLNPVSRPPPALVYCKLSALDINPYTSG